MGLGIEHETYLETNKLKQITLKELKENRKRERYCVDYYNVYNISTLDTALDGLFEPDKEILIPILVNSHTFQKTDINGEHATTYERVPKCNPKFNGKTIFQWMKEENPDIFLNDYNKSFTFDGDTLEFMTQNFYKATVSSVLNELSTIEKDFIRGLNSLPREGLFKIYAPFQIAQKNYGFASYLTNLKNNAMFNNGTIHINITLPTKLNNEGGIMDFDVFKKKHQNLARAIQWVSPLLVASYGSYDPLCESKINGELFAAGSQRVAVSRYIGLGTYDTDNMEQGKILTRSRTLLNNIDWYNEFHKLSSLKFLDELGMDINFNKHYAHGIEFRILDALPNNSLEEILKFIIYLADFSLEHTLTNPIKSHIWHKFAYNCVQNGKGYYIDVSDQNELFKIFKINYNSKEPLTPVDILEILINNLKLKYNNGLCVNLMINNIPYEKIIEMNSTTIVPPTTSVLPTGLISSPTIITLTLPSIKEYEPDSQETSRSESIESNDTIVSVLTQNIGVQEVLKKKNIWCCT